MSSSISGDLAGEIRLLLESETEAALRPGQRLPARVIEMLLTGDVLLELGQSRATVPTSTPLQPGDRVRLEVVTAGPTPAWTPRFDRSDDLDGLLSARSPLLRRAFGTDGQ